MKFATVTEDVKRSIIESSLSNPNILVSLGLGPNGINNEPVNGSNGGGKKLKNRLSTPLLRKPKSTQSLRGDADRHAASMALRSGAHSRGMSLDVPRPQRAVPGQPFIMLPSTPTSRPVSASPRPTGASETPEVFVRWLEASRATDLSMSVDRMKKLRMLLRHELTSWVMTFLNAGGYIQMLARIQDLLDIEWRCVSRQ
jgi:hypothetical protein